MRIIVVGGSICPVIRQTLQDLHDIQFTEDAGSLDTLDALSEPVVPQVPQGITIEDIEKRVLPNMRLYPECEKNPLLSLKHQRRKPKRHRRK